MADPFGNLSGGDAAAAYGVYQSGKRAAPFVKGAIDAGQGALLGADVARSIAGRGVAGAVGRTAVGTAVREAAVMGAARLGIGVGAGVASGAASGAAAGSIVPGVGTLVGAAIGAAAPLILPHIPVVGAAVNKIPVVGGMLSPSKKKDSGGGNPLSTYVAPSPFTATGAEYSAGQRAQYSAGRGYRR